ncbi:hypothetical protein HXX76_003881 [Chlamydomonas incerta]|uniref:PAS domain-containing protein n=1 Tax=Chlamydomonas incerta TaxID=51695 RepID=A0A835W854_CHLIN|nr:hypothetical protein HXX76_003881 [Chlamydomonas incerta]|eukprot:KAG2441028.1 hypothetical protein HXX76_003881 [Chlamydomonas incerta]
MYTLVRQVALSSWKFAVIKVVLEGLCSLIVIFNPSMRAWSIDTNNYVWQVIRWTVWRSPIMRLYGYHTYILVLYIMVAAVFVALMGLVWLTLAMRRQEHSKWLKTFATALHVVFDSKSIGGVGFRGDVMFIQLYISFFDYFVFAANCNFASAVKNHVYFTDVMCLKMPHILHMGVAGVTAVLFFAITGFMVIASSDLNPVSRGYLASPAAITRLKILCAKAVFVIVADDMQSWPKPQAIGILITVLLIWWWNFRRVPFYRPLINVVWCSMWSGILYVAVLLTIVAFKHGVKTNEYRTEMTMNVLYGIFPVIVGSWGICAVHNWWVMRASSKFKDLPPGVKISRVHKFDDPQEVEVLCRVMRKFDIDGVVDEEAGALGETIIKAGLQSMPSSPFLYILYANFLLEVKKDGPASRTQLQLAAKHGPSFIERYQIFCTGEASKRLKDSQDGGMDLQAYIEFRRNFRAVVRVHKEVLLLQAELWELLSKSAVKVRDVDKAFDELEAGTQRAHQVYKRVLERYPTNGKLLRVYGKFLEDVKHDTSAASRAYTEASRNGGGDAIMNLDLSAVQGNPSKPEFLTSMSMEDDAVIVINAEGTIMMTSQAVSRVFGYNKGELEGNNVSVLMPPPFSQRHASYLQRYAAGGEPRILDSVREVIALHKERYVMPMSLCVTKMSGTGTDSVFLGVVRPMPSNTRNVRCWVAPSGVILCGDQQFASMIGVTEGEVVGRTLLSLTESSPTEVETLLERCRDATASDLESRTMTASLVLAHRYLDPVPVDITIGMAGTDNQRIYVLSFNRTDGEEGNMIVVDTHMRMRFCSAGVSTLLGFPMRKLATMRLDQLLPPPYNTLHAKWLKDPTATPAVTSCRSGRVVHLLNENGNQVPVRIKVRSTTGAGGQQQDGMALYVVSMDKVGADELYDEKRLVVTTSFDGRVLEVSRPDAELFDFRAADLLGHSLHDFVDVFTEWRDRNGADQMQLFIMALLEKEKETPGSSWRVRVQAPPTQAAPHLPAINGTQKPPGAGAKRPSRSACLQVEMDESEVLDEDGKPVLDEFGQLAVRLRVTLWRRDLLAGVVEMDDQMVIKKANIMAGLIVGLPSSILGKKPLQKFIDGVDATTTWSQLVEKHAKGHNKKRSALKGTVDQGTISPQMAFIGPHPDTGNMRIILQGVSVLAPGGRPRVTVTVHPDVTFAAAHADLMRVLKLDQLLAQASHVHRQHLASRGDEALLPGGSAQHGQDQHDGQGKQGRASPGGDMAGPAGSGSGAAGGEEADDQSDGGRRSGSEGGEGGADGRLSDDDEANAAAAGGAAGDTGGRDLMAEDQAHLHRKAGSKSEFVEQWVRTLTNRTSGGLEAAAGGQQHQAPQPHERRGSGLPPSRTGSNVPPSTPPTAYATAHSGGLLAAIPEEGVLALTDASRHGGEAGGGDYVGAASRQTSRFLESPPEGKQRGADTQELGPGGPDGGAAGEDAAKGEAWEKGSEGGESSADGSQAASGITSVTDGSTGGAELLIDSRRARLLKMLSKMLLGATLADPMEKLRVHSYILLALMMCMHIISYAIIKHEIDSEYHDVQLVYRQSLAMDRSQLIVVRAMMGAYCARENVTAKVGVCANTMDFTVGKITENILFMESHHQFVYMGDIASTTVKLPGRVYGIWTEPDYGYSAWMDTAAPRFYNQTGGVWILGCRFIAAAREGMFWLRELGAEYRLHRTYKFLVDNGLGALFDAYSHSLDLLVDSAWKSVDDLKKVLIVLLVIEGLVVQLGCLIYEWVLVQRLERARVYPLLAMVGLPGPVLRQLGSKDAQLMLDESDDEDDGDQSDQEEEGRGGGGGGGGAHDDAASQQGGGSVVGGEGGGKGLAAKLAGGKTQKALMSHNPADGVGAAAVVKHATDESSEMGNSEHHHRHKHGSESGASGTGAVIKMKEARVEGLRVNGKDLIPNRANVITFMAPFVVWNVALIVIYTVSFVQLSGMQQPLASLNMASTVIYRYTRVRAVAFGFVSQDSIAERNSWREQLVQELAYFESEYNSLMYGGTPITQVDAVFNKPVPASTFASASFASEFFRAKRCFRYEQDTCFQPGDQYYEVTHNGLDVMCRRMIAEMHLLTQDADQDVAYNGSRYMFMSSVGGHDLYEGLQQAAELFVRYSESRYNEVATLHAILLIVCIVLVVGYLLLVLWPHLGRVKSYAERQAGLLSHVPPEMDVRGHVRHVLRRAMATVGWRPRIGGNRGSAHGGGGGQRSSMSGTRPRRSSALGAPSAGKRMSSELGAGAGTVAAGMPSVA